MSHHTTIITIIFFPEVTLDCMMLSCIGPQSQHRRKLVSYITCWNFLKTLTKSTLKGLRTYFTIHYLVKAGPYKWDKSPNGITRVTSKLDWLQIIVFSIWFLVRVARNPYDVPVVFINGASLRKVAMTLVHVVWFISLFFYQVNLYLHAGQLQQLINCLVAFNRQTARE